MCFFRRSVNLSLLVEMGHIVSLSLAYAASTPTFTASPNATTLTNVRTTSTSQSSLNTSSTSHTTIPLPSPTAGNPLQPLGSFPQIYDNLPSGDFSPDWQKYYLVTEGLPSITFPLPRNFAGNIPVNRANHPNNTIFFWAFETTMGSLTATAAQLTRSPWMIWLGGGGGPGSSSLFTAMSATGPMIYRSESSILQNDMSWTNIIDMVYVDQPVGVGFSTSDSDGYINDEDEMGADFVGFLSNLVKVFPSLSKRPLILAGEDYAGVYIPYIAKTIWSSPSPPVQLSKLTIGNGLFDTTIAPHLSAVSILESYPQLINYDKDVFQSFVTQQHQCGFDLNLTYPQRSPLLVYVTPSRRSTYWQSGPTSLNSTTTLDRRSSWIIPENIRNRQSSSVSSTTDNPYECSLFDEMIDYAMNFSSPWTSGTFDIFDVSNVLKEQPTLDLGPYFNSFQVRNALHAPTSKNWVSESLYPFESTTNISIGGMSLFGDPAVEPRTFFADLVTNASSHNTEIVLYSGVSNAISHHKGLEVMIQDTVFGGTQGFTRKPSTPWADDSGNVAGIVHQERGLVYALFDGVGHMIPNFKPDQALVFYREFVINSNATGSLTTDSKGNPTALGGEDSALEDDVPRIQTELFIGTSATQGTVFAEPATVSAWATFLATARPVPDVSSNAQLMILSPIHGLALLWTALFILWSVCI